MEQLATEMKTFLLQSWTFFDMVVYGNRLLLWSWSQVAIQGHVEIRVSLKLAQNKDRPHAQRMIVPEGWFGVSPLETDCAPHPGSATINNQPLLSVSMSVSNRH